MTSAAVTVLGGGVTGLSTAWYLAKHLPSSAAIKLVESSGRLGGRVWTERRQINANTSIIAEKGPRTLRAGQTRETQAVLELIDDLDLKSQVTTCPKTSAAARNRYIYYKGDLNRMPTGLGSLITGLPPAVRCLPGGIWRDLTTKNSNEDKGTNDESIHDFVSRRFGSQVDDNLASAVMHGIYATDTRNLSARALLYPFWLADRTGKTGVLRGLRRVAKISRARNAQFGVRDAEEALSISRRRRQDPEFWRKMNESSTFSFTEGMQVLTDRLGESLRALPNVEIVTGDPAIEAQEVNSNGVAQVTLAGGRSLLSHHVISALPLTSMGKIFKEPTPLINEIPYSSIAVVNVTYTGRGITPVDGFGYLVPRASAHESQALGVVFDSCSLPDQDGGADVSRLTVMLGGSRFKELFGDPHTVTKDVLETAALETIRTQLGINEAPVDIDATVCAECIPTYTVGYVDRLKTMNEWVNRQLGGRLSVVGAAYGGPAVPQCVVHARDLVCRHLKLDDLAAVSSNPQNVSGLDEIIRGFE